MKTYLIIGSLAVLIGAGIFFFVSTKQSPPADTQGNANFPVAAQAGSGSWAQGAGAASSSPAQSGILLPTQSGAAVVAKDFIHNGLTTPDPSNPGNYYLTGSTTPGYAIGYRTPAQFFTIALEEEPLGQTRYAAEEFLLSTLGLSESQLCDLGYYIGTDVYTNSFYAGKDLRFSFCPGATPLPK